MSHYERARFQRRMGLCWPCQKVVKFQNTVTFEMPAPSLVTLVIGRCPHCYATMHSRANPTEYCDVCDLEVIDVGPWPFGCQCNRPPDQMPRPTSGPKPASFWRRHSKPPTNDGRLRNMTDKHDRKLVYYTDEADNMLFAPKALVEEAFALREVLPGCATWGDVRAALTDEQFARVSEGFIHPREFEAEKPVGGELDDWPVIYYHQIADEFIPESVLQQIGTEYSGALDSGWTLSAYDEDEIIQTLEENGFSCESRDDLGELFRL